MAKVTATQILKDAAELKEQKSKDYQGGKWTEADYFPFGDESYMHMIHTKYLRMRNIMETKNPNFESLEDTLIDMINYCAMYAAHLENSKMDGETADAPKKKDLFTFNGKGEKVFHHADKPWANDLVNNNNLSQRDLDVARQLWEIQKERT